MMPGTLVLYARAPSGVQDHLLVLEMFGGNPRPISFCDRAWSWSSFCCHLRSQAVQDECLRSASLNHTSPLFPLKLRSACIGDHLFLAEINFVRFNVCPSILLAKDDLVLQDPNMSCPCKFQIGVDPLHGLCVHTKQGWYRCHRDTCQCTRKNRSLHCQGCRRWTTCAKEDGVKVMRLHPLLAPVLPASMHPNLFGSKVL